MTCSFCIFKKSGKNCVASSENYSTVEIRPSRYLRIQHIKARSKDAISENGWQIHLQQKHKKVHSPKSQLMPKGEFSNSSHQKDIFLQGSALPESSNIASQVSESKEVNIPNGVTNITNNHVGKDIVIFFIHGVGGSSDIWCAQLQYFSDQGYEIVAPDLIGHGLSSSARDARDYHFQEIAADIEEIFYRYHKRKNVVVGHSYGASFASILARNHPRHIIRLILISGGPPTPLLPQPGVFSLPYCIFACIQPCLLSKFYSGAFYNKKKTVIPQEEAFNIPANVLQHTMNGQDWPEGDQRFYGWITCPSLLIYGAQDQLVSLQDEKDMSEVIYGSRLEVIDTAGHMVMIEAPDEVNHVIEEFISKAEPIEDDRNNS